MTHPFKYDRFQQEAIDYINQGLSVIVSAPTGAGKTAIAEHVISTSMEKNSAVIYTAPIKALSNQKYRDFQEQFADNIGILTGDVSINKDAPVLIMTTEILRNRILNEPESLNKYSWVIFDEIHYIDNEERGTVWEESIILLPHHINILGLSATIPNISQFSEWIESVQRSGPNPFTPDNIACRRQVKMVVEEHRPVPLHFYFQNRNQVFDKLSSLHKQHGHGRQSTLTGIIDYVQQKEGFPCIYFVFSRKRAEELAYDLYSYNFLDKQQKEEIRALYESLIERYDLKNDKTALGMRHLVYKGIAFHHAGMLPTLKEVIERLFTSRLLKVIFTTETFALGINMPSRSVIFDSLRKYYGGYIRNLKTRDFYQMAGRAGRRGIDDEGFVYCRVNMNFSSQDEIKRIIYGKPEEVRSQFNTSYATILNLYERYKEKVFDIYPLSFHYFQTGKHQRQDALKLMETKLRLLKELSYIKDGELTVKGKFASKLYGYELVLSELYEDGIFEQVDEFGLAVISAGVVFEPRKNQQAAVLSKSTKGLRDLCEDVYERIRRREHVMRIHPFSKKPFFHLSLAMEYWLRGTEFQKLSRYTDTDEGEVVRYFRMSMQVLREILETGVCSERLQEKIKDTLRVLNRGVVDAEKQLREG